MKARVPLDSREDEKDVEQLLVDALSRGVQVELDDILARRRWAAAIGQATPAWHAELGMRLLYVAAAALAGLALWELARWLLGFVTRGS